MPIYFQAFWSELRWLHWQERVQMDDNLCQSQQQNHWHCVLGKQGADCGCLDVNISNILLLEMWHRWEWKTRLSGVQSDDIQIKTKERWWTKSWRRKSTSVEKEGERSKERYIQKGEEIERKEMMRLVNNAMSILSWCYVDLAMLHSWFYVYFL